MNVSGTGAGRKRGKERLLKMDEERKREGDILGSHNDSKTVA
jgi:hypothetical protein